MRAPRRSQQAPLLHRLAGRRPPSPAVVMAVRSHAPSLRGRVLCASQVFDRVEVMNRVGRHAVRRGPGRARRRRPSSRHSTPPPASPPPSWPLGFNTALGAARPYRPRGRRRIGTAAGSRRRPSDHDRRLWPSTRWGTTTRNVWAARRPPPHCAGPALSSVPRAVRVMIDEGQLVRRATGCPSVPVTSGRRVNSLSPCPGQVERRFVRSHPVVIESRRCGGIDGTVAPCRPGRGSDS
jgi:hypothetical protein